MISRSTTRAGAKVTFTVAALAPVSLVGDFNGWDHTAHPMQGRANGLRSITVTLEPGSYAFRYLADGGLFFDDPDADDFVSNAHGGIDGVVIVPEQPAGAATKPPAKKAAAKPAAKKTTAKKSAAKSTKKAKNA